MAMVSGSMEGDTGEEYIASSITAYLTLSNRPPASARLPRAACQDSLYRSAAGSPANAATLSCHTNRPTLAQPDHETPPCRAVRREFHSDPPRTGVHWSATLPPRRC